MTQKEVKNQYHSLYLDAMAEKTEVLSLIRRIGMLRIVFFLLWILMIYITSSWTWVAFGIVIILGTSLFAFLVKKHSKLHRRKAILEQLIRINREEENAIEWNYADLDDGSGYMNDSHLYTHDLDIFGKGSLFQYINRTSTIPGKDRLAELLSYIETSPDEIKSRQNAITDLKGLLKWRQDFRVLGLLVDEQSEDISELESWVLSPTDFNNIFFKVLIILIPLVNLFVLVLTISNVITLWQFLAYLVIPLLIAGIKHRKINLKHNLLSRKYKILKKYSELFGFIENKTFTSTRMKNLQRDLIQGGSSAGRAIRDLAKIANAFDTRLNLLAGFLMNIFFLWDIRQSLRLESWQMRYRDRLSAWFRVLAETDAYISLAGYSYNNPEYKFPAIVETESFLFDAEELGHPLIHSAKRVCNNYRVAGWGNFTILTGANMAGKSTFLRTIGINMVLASCGAPLCAKKFSYTPVDLVTSIHTIDSLANNESYFYAELKRLKLIIDMLKEGKQIFIILDEILKGTNSNDKQSGSRALVRQLISLKASGIIATHDLSLGDLESYFPQNIHNQCFEIIIEKDRLEYDYKVKPGIATNMNASILMRRMGITDI